MSDQPAAIYPLPALRVSATFPITDGSPCPESIDIEFGDGTPVDGHLVREVISALAAVADPRFAVSTAALQRRENAAEVRCTP